MSGRRSRETLLLAALLATVSAPLSAESAAATPTPEPRA